MRFTRVRALVFTSLAFACASRPSAAPAPQVAPTATATAPVATLPAQSVARPTLVVTTSAAPFATGELAPSSAPASAVVTVDLTQRAQVISAFGGAFNEMGWDALRVLSDADRQAVLHALFDRRTGLDLDYCRLPIGASDYALDRYTLNETPGDYPMTRFSIERDKKHLIPYVKAALGVRPDLKLWASAWTPPTWMKTNAAFDGGAFKDDPKIYAAYALYLARYVESYEKEGIRVSMVVPQNEPAQLTHYPSCDWKPEQYVTFLRDHAAPTFKQRGLSTELYIGTINRKDWDVLSVLRDPGVASVVSGVGIQWNALVHAPALRSARPDLPLMQTETECGNHHWLPEFNPERPPNDFAYAAYTWRKFRDYFRAGASSYMLWNLVLDEHGKNIDSARPWPQNAAVVVDRPSRTVIYTPMFWATKHFSRLVGRGARFVASSGAYDDQLAFVNPDGTAVVELLNTSQAPVSLSVAVAGKSHPLTLPPQSFATLLVPPA